MAMGNNFENKMTSSNEMNMASSGDMNMVDSTGLKGKYYKE